MGNSNSKLLNYINHLMHDDGALRKFVVDPITDAEGKHGLTKAERAVLRRTVAGLSNNSVNGYSIDRSLSSYRRSLRLLQNVLHHVGSKMIQDHGFAPELASTGGGVLEPGQIPFNVVVNYPNISGSSQDFTKKTNSDVDAQGGPYANSTRSYYIQVQEANPTIQQVLDTVNFAYNNPIPYTVVSNNGNDYLLGFTIKDAGQTITADLSQYQLTDDYVFWFYTVNGEPSKGGSGHFDSGSIGQSFTEYNLSYGDTVFWQLIAPDSTYGFAPCPPHPQNAFAKAQR